MGEWRTMESAPKDGTPVLLWPGRKVWTDETVPAAGWWAGSIGGWVGDCDFNPTHWQHLPEPPASPTLRETVDAIRAKLTPEQLQAIADMAEDSRPAVRGVE